MDIYRIIREQIQALEGRLIQRLANLVQITTTTRSTAKGDEDGADGWPDAGGSYQRGARRMQHFGFRSVPPKNTARLMLLVGGGNGSEVTVAEDGSGYGPDTLADGETGIYCKASGTLIKLDADGNITINAAAGKDVTVNGGTAKVARVGDHSGNHNHTATFTLTAPAGGGAVTGSITIANTNPTLPEGADHFKA